MSQLIEVGSIIAARYLLKSLVGEGGMASVWRAEDQTLKRMVAIKLLYVRGQRDPRAMVDQFLREARIAASVQHRNVIHTVDFGIAGEQLPYMVMELLNGESLAERMEREPALVMEEVVHLASLTLRGLGAVHEAGIVHRDLKPQNIFLHRDVDTVYPKILDFGISRALAADGALESAISTQDGMIVGTPDYMSPEQARGENDIDRRADIYSMGAIIYEGITGRLPYEADTIGELIVKIVTTRPPSMKHVRPDVPELLSDCVAQAMAYDREERFIDATVFRRALLSAAEKAFSANVARHPQTSEAPPRMAPRPISAPVAVVPLPPSTPFALPLPPSAAPGSVPTAWGDFEGLGGRSPRAGGQEKAAESFGTAPTAFAVPAPSQSSAQPASGGALEPSMLGDNPFDPLGASMGGAGTLDIDYDRNVRTQGGMAGNLAAARVPHSPVQRSAVQYARGASPAANGRQQQAGRRTGSAAVRRKAESSWSAIWALPALLLVGLILLLFAPGIFSLPAPDARGASDFEAKNPATAGSDRQLQGSRRHDLKARPPALRDVLF